jgi:multiple sugar transport system substrate-binding protein
MKRSMGLAALVLSVILASAGLAWAEDVVYIGWSHTESGSKPVLEKTFAGFKAANPGINLEAVGVPVSQMETTLMLRRRSNQRVDVAQMQERWLPIFAASGGLVDPSEVLGRDYLAQMYHPTAISMGQVRGKQLGVPWVFGSTGMVAHGKVTAEAGVTNLPHTMQQFTEALRKIKKAKPASSPWGFTTKDVQLNALEAELVFWQFGAKFLDDNGNVLVDSPEGRRAMQFLADMVKEGLILPGNDRFDVRRLFSQELIGFYLDPPVARAFARAQSGQGEVYDKYVIPMPMPVVKGGDKSLTIQWAHLLVMYQQGSARPGADGAAAKLVKHITSTESQLAYYKEAGVFPANKAALASLSSDQFMSRWIELSVNAQPDEPAKFTNSADIRRVIGEEVIAGMLGQKTPEAAITTMASRLKAARPTP